MRMDRVTQSITDLIVRSLDPEKIILFGSVAQGRTRPDSDIDLLVMARFNEPRTRRGMELRGLLASKAVHVDLHLRTYEEFTFERYQQHSLVDTAIRYGKILYQRRV